MVHVKGLVPTILERLKMIRTGALRNQTPFPVRSIFSPGASLSFCSTPILRMGMTVNHATFPCHTGCISRIGMPLNFHSTPALNAEPLRKRKRIDPAILKAQAEKRKIRYMRDIRRLEKVAKKLKPITELEVPKKILKESNRQRTQLILEEEEICRRAALEREWAVYKYNQHIKEINVMNRLIASQEKAMDALKEASPELYEQALQLDPMLIPFHMTGPHRTPPIEKFDYPDGAYIDITKQYLPIIPVVVKQKKGRVNSSKNK